MTIEARARGDAAPAGRPRDELREQAILDAAIELLTEVGYDCLSIDMLATRARASKATIYRRWSGKAAVVAEAVRRRKCAEQMAEPDTGSLRDDLLALLTASGSGEDEEDAAFIAGLIRAMRADQELNELMHLHVIGRKHAVAKAIVDRAVARGELESSAGAETMVEVVQALVTNRLLLDGSRLDAEFVTRVVDDVALPLLRR